MNKFRLAVSLFATAVILLPTLAFGAAAMGNGCTGWVCNTPTGFCAPEDVEKNVVKVEKTLKRLAADSSFADSASFQKRVDEIAEIQEPQAKLDAYLSLVGVSTEEGFVKFLGARNMDLYVATAMRNLELDRAQAETVLTEVQGHLVGDLK